MRAPGLLRRVSLPLAALTLVAAHPVSGQNESVRFGVGYVANAPEMMSGGSATIILPAFGGIGLYFDAKFNPDSPRKEETFIDGTTALQVEDEVPGVRFQDALDSYNSFNVALVRPVAPALMLYLGGGISQMTRYRQYRDPEEEMGRAGYFWVEGPDESANVANLLVGAFLRISPLISMQTGFETNPKGFTVGATLLYPRR